MQYKKLGTVTVVTSRGRVTEYDSLTKAVQALGETVVDGYKDHLPLRYSSEWNFIAGNDYEFRDELGLRIPAWKVREAFQNLPFKLRNRWYRYYSRRAGQFTFRDGPVTGIRCFRGGGHYDRPIKTTAEKRANEACEADGEGAYVRSKRKSLPDYYDDPPFARRGNGWKNYRKTQYKAVDIISHSHYIDDEG